MCLSAEIVLDYRAELGECPVWDARTAELLWVNGLAGELHRFDPVSGTDAIFTFDRAVAFVVPRARGGVLVGLPDSFVALDANWSFVEWLTAVQPADSGAVMNDGKCDPAGRLWAGTMDSGSVGRRSGSLYRFDPDLRLTKVFGGIACSNGLGWSPDGRLMYYVDTGTNRIDVLDYELSTGEATNRRQLVRLEQGEGLPDGLTVDKEGCVWVALWGGSAVRRYTPDGRLDAIVRVPAMQPSSCTFGGSELSELYITSAFEGYSTEQMANDPLAGAIFRACPGVLGLPATAFAG